MFVICFFIKLLINQSPPFWFRVGWGAKLPHRASNTLPPLFSPALRAGARLEGRGRLCSRPMGVGSKAPYPLAGYG